LCCRWGFVTHGCIDGYSRAITFLETATSNAANVVLNLFVQACSNLGLPSRVRCDRGGENMHVALFMNLVRGSDRNSVIAGKSVHNQRIERLWRDVAVQVTHFFYELFYQMEDEQLLDIENEKHIVALHLIFIPIINSRMSVFRKAWNCHPIRTANNQTPEQLWTRGMLENARSGHTVTTELFDRPITIRTCLEEALSTFNIDVQNFVATNGVNNSPEANSLDSETMESIAQANLSVTDLKVQFKNAVDILLAM
jgi:hypothetical protein